MPKFTETPQWNSGSDVADFLDKYYRDRGWKVWNTTPDEERRLCLGDRHFERDGRHLLIEYKSGVQTHYTGKVFLETISVDKDNKPGWVYTCKADFLLYACLPDHKILMFVPETLRNQIEDLKRKFKEVSTRQQQNKDYNTWGVVVPLDYVMTHLTVRVVDLKP